jgi:hypothetical protein
MVLIILDLEFYKLQKNYPLKHKKEFAHKLYVSSFYQTN